MSTVIEIKDEEQYHKLVAGTDLQSNITHLIINFGAPWCVSCKLLKKSYDELTSKYPNIVFAKFNIDDMEDLAQELGVVRLPTFMFHNMKQKSISHANLSTSNIAELIKKIDTILSSNIQTTEDF